MQELLPPAERPVSENAKIQMSLLKRYAPPAPPLTIDRTLAQAHAASLFRGIENAGKLLNYDLKRVKNFSTEQDLQAIILLAGAHYALAELPSELYALTLNYIESAYPQEKKNPRKQFYLNFVDHEFDIYAAVDKINTDFAIKILQDLFPTIEKKQLYGMLTALKIHAYENSRRNSGLISDTFLLLTVEQHLNQIFRASFLVRVTDLYEDAYSYAEKIADVEKDLTESINYIGYSIDDANEKLAVFKALNRYEESVVDQDHILAFLAEHQLLYAIESTKSPDDPETRERTIAKNNATIENARYWLMLPENKARIPQVIAKLEVILTALEETRKKLEKTYDSFASLKAAPKIAPFIPRVDAATPVSPNGSAQNVRYFTMALENALKLVLDAFSYTEERFIAVQKTDQKTPPPPSSASRPSNP